MRKLSKALIPLVSPSPPSFLQGFLVWLLPAPTVIPCPKWQQLIHLPLNDFDKHHPGSHISPGKALRQSKQRETFEPVFQWSTRQVKTTQLQFFENKICIVPSGTSNLHQECRLFSSRPPWVWEVGEGNRVS